MAWPRRNGPVAGLLLALVAAGTLLIALGWSLTFFQDTWAFLLERPGLTSDSLLTPHNEHLVVFQVALEKLLVEIFGMTSARPEMLVMTATLLGCAALLFVYVCRRVGPWPALMAAVLLLFLGSGWQVQLWAFEIEFTMPLLCGLAMLLLLDRDDPAADAWSCLLLIVGIGFGSLGLSFAAAALVDVFLKRRQRGWGRIWFVVVPLLFYAAWYVGWGRDAEHHLTLRNILDSPPYVFDGFASSVGSLAGLSTTPVVGVGQPEWGRPLLVALAVLAALGLRRRPLPATFWPVAAAAFSFWLLAAFNYIPGREATSLRYVYAGSAFSLLLAAELLRGVRFSSRALLIGAALVVVVVMPNLVQMKDGANWLEEQSALTRADIGAMEIAERTISPDFVLSPEVAGTGSLINVDAAELFPAVEEHGSPGYSPGELAEAPLNARHYADVVLSRALPLSVEVHEGGLRRTSPVSKCVEQAPGGEVELEPGVSRVEVAPGEEAILELRRFAEGEYPVATEGSPGGSTTVLRIPRDKATRPWYLHVEADQMVRVCPA